MAQLPITGVIFPRFNAGADFTYTETLTWATNLGDPNDVDDWLFVIHVPGGTDVEVEGTPTITGSGPWTVGLAFSLASTDTDLDADTYVARVLYGVDGGNRDVILEGTVEVLEMHSEEWP